MRWADARAATRRGWSMTRLGWSLPSSPARRIAGGTRVVFPAPGSATSTSARDPARFAVIWGRNGSMGRGTMAAEGSDAELIQVGPAGLAALVGLPEVAGGHVEAGEPAAVAGVGVDADGVA